MRELETLVDEAADRNWEIREAQELHHELL